MATAPMKSQPLHNFSLSLLKWGNKNQINNHRFRKRDSPPSTTAAPHSPYSEPESKLPTTGGGSTRYGKNRFGSCSAMEESNDHDENEKKDSDVVLRNGDDEKLWNLRPRRAHAKGGLEIIAGELQEKERERAVQSPPVSAVRGENLPKSMRLRGFVDTQGSSEKKKEKKMKFWISLSRDEIEEDIFVMTGSKPSRRPRKRSKNVQKNVDNVLPGLWLAGMTAEAFRVPDAPAKG